MSQRSVMDVVSDVWTAVLRTEISGPDANFFALGGNSLQGSKAISQLRQELGIRIPLSVLFEAQTLAELTAAIESMREEESGAAQTIQPFEGRSGEVFHAPTSFTQQRLWVDEHIQGPSSRYNIPVANELVGPLDTAALKQAV